MKSIIMFFILFKICLNFLYAQKLDDVKEMYANYINIDTLVTDMRIRIYPNTNDGYISKQISLKKVNNKYLYAVDGNIMLNTNEYSLFVNNAQHQLVISSNKDKKTTSTFNLNIIDTLLQKCDSISKPIKNGSKIKYCLFSEKQQIYKTCMDIDTVNHFLIFVSYDYNKNSEDLKRVEIDIDNSTSISGNIKEIEINNYLMITDDHKYLPTKKYYNYEVITMD